MANNIFQEQVTPTKPKILESERIYVYMPKAASGNKGLASFNQRDFSSPDGHASLRWPMEMLVENLADPTVRPSLTKVLGDEFIKTNNPVSVINPVTGVSYTSNTAEIQINRENRKALERPDLVMLNNTDFQETLINLDGKQYSRYDIRRKNPLTEPTLVQVDNDDFTRRIEADNSIVQVNWPYAHDPTSGTDKTNSYGLVRIAENKSGSLSYDEGNNLKVDLDALKTNLGGYLNSKPTYGETNITNWPTRDQFIDSETGLAKRDANGNILLNLTKQSIGLSNVENRTFASRTYDEFGATMKNHFDTQFGLKLDRSFWDGPTGLFRDWTPPSDNRNTVQKWFTRLEEEDESIWSSIRSLRLFLGFFVNESELNGAYAPSATLMGTYAVLVSTSTNWAMRPIDVNRYQFIFRDNTGLESLTGQEVSDRAVNLNDGQEYVWNGTIWVSDGVHNEAWEWYDTTVQNLSFLEFVETDAAALKPNAPIANVSVGISGKWIQSDHVHPSDPSKLDADILNDMILNVTTLAPSGNDFNTLLSEVIVLNNVGSPINATIVISPEYLSGIPSPTTGDLAIARNTSQVFQYTGSVWSFVYLGTITYDTDSTINIPFIRTTQYLHNWKSSPTSFIQGPNTNEYYWAGSKEEFDNLDLDDIPNGAMLHVDDGEGLEPGHFVNKEQLNTAGILVSDEANISTERIVMIDRSINLSGVPVTLVNESASGELGERRRLQALDFGPVLTSPENHRMAITVTSANGTTLSHRSFTPNRFIQSNASGNLETSTTNPNNFIVTSASSDQVDLTADRLIKATGSKTVESWNTGTVSNRPITSNGTSGAKVLALTANRLLLSDNNGGLTTSNTLPGNLVMTRKDSVSQVLSTNKVVLSDSDNTVKTWSSGGAEGSILERGANDGEIRLRSHIGNNRILITGPNGTLQEVASGTTGQYLVSGGSNPPGWVNGPSIPTVLPQTRFTTNPDASVANALNGLAAVILSSPPLVTELRNNCIYYY